MGAFFIAFGVPFMAAGWLLGSVAAGAIPASTADGSPRPPDWVMWSLAALFGGAGAFVTLKLGVGSLIGRSRLRARRARHPDEPWRADHSWDPAGATYSPGSSLAGQFAVMAFMAALLAPFNYFAFYAAAAGHADLGQAPRGVLRPHPGPGGGGHRHDPGPAGQVRPRAARLPVVPVLPGGHAVRAPRARSRPIGQFKKLTLTLRCIEERTETTHSGGKTTIRTVCDQLWSDEVSLEGGAVREGHEVPVSFDLPSGDYGTRLAEAPARYWELAVLADTPGLDFSAKFLVPVYASGREIREQVLVPERVP